MLLLVGGLSRSFQAVLRVGLRRVLAGLVCVPPKPRLASWLSGKSCLCPAEGRGLGRRGGCPLFRGSQLLLKTASLDAGQMAPFLLACCSSVLVQSPVWCLGRAVPRWLEELGAWGRGDLSETLHCRALPLLPGSRPHLLPVPHLLNADKVPVSQKLGES